MANVIKLRDKARALELREQWKEALQVYEKIVEEATPDEIDIGVWNRMGDLYTRTGQPDRAVGAYEKAVDAYADSGLYNNAIALCNKILRAVPGRAAVYLRLGQISAAQGFLADARRNFLQYAERMQRAGQIDASFAALKEFVDLVPGDEDSDVRRLLADQLLAHGRGKDAIEQLRLLRGKLESSGRVDEARAIADQILSIDANADVSALHDSLDADAATAKVDTGGFGGGLDLIANNHTDAAPPAAAPAEAAPAFAPDPSDFAQLDIVPTMGDSGAKPDKETVEGLQGFEPTAPPEVSEDGGALPLLGGDLEISFSLPEPLSEPLVPARRAAEEEDTAVDGEELPVLSLDDALLTPSPPAPAPGSLEDLRRRVAAKPGDAVAWNDLASLLRERGSEAEAEASLRDAHRHIAAAGHYAAAVGVVRQLLETELDDTVLHQKQVEYAFRSGDRSLLVRAYLDLGANLLRTSPPKAQSVYQRVLDLDPQNAEARGRLAAAPPAPAAPPPADNEDSYIDLGSLILDDELEGDGSTRFVVAEEEPSGDEDQDFADMLSVFRQKVTENIDAGDSSSHYDLGLAFKEMGLLDEAVAQFQVALRGGANPLATLEVLGDCFVEKGQHTLAVRVLERALRLDAGETEFLGVHYLLGRSKEVLGNLDGAREHYERVLASDIRFRDAAQRLEGLRQPSGSEPF